MDFKEAGRIGRGRPNMTWKRQVKEDTNKIGLKMENPIDRAKWRNGVYELSRITRRIRPPALTQTTPDLKKWIFLSYLSFIQTSFH